MWLHDFSVAYRYRKSMSIIERVLYIYIHISWHHRFAIPPSCSLKFTGWAIIKLSIRRRVLTFLISWGQKTCEKHCYVDLSQCYQFWFAKICINMNVILDLSIGTRHCSCFGLSNGTYQSWQSERQRHHRWNAYLTSMFGHYIGGYIID